MALTRSTGMWGAMGRAVIGRAGLLAAGFAADQGDRATGTEPLMTAGHFVDVDGDGRQEVVFSNLLDAAGPSRPPRPVWTWSAA